MADEEIFFMRVDEPVEVRKQLLESARVSVQTLQQCERFKRIRSQKAKAIAKLRSQVKELSDLYTKLRERLPDAAPGPEGAELTRVLKKDAKEKTRELHKEHLNPDKAIQKLHHQLRAIEHKLNSLA